MNAVEIEEAVSKLIEVAFDAAEFPYAFLEAFGNKDATIRRLRSTGKNTTNKTDVDGDGVVSVLQRNNIHIATCGTGFQPFYTPQLSASENILPLGGSSVSEGRVFASVSPAGLP